MADVTRDVRIINEFGLLLAVMGLDERSDVGLVLVVAPLEFPFQALNVLFGILQFHCHLISQHGPPFNVVLLAPMQVGLGTILDNLVDQLLYLLRINHI